jgi:sugar lactone lactonase YvrE
LAPNGEIDVEVELPTAWLITCVVFGGAELKDLYITTAASDYIGDDLPERFDGGSLFVVKDVGYTGVERNRFKGGVIW